MMKIKELFFIRRGHELDVNKQRVVLCNRGVNLVGQGCLNLGVSCLIERIKNIPPFSKGLITVASGGSILSSYVQMKEFYTVKGVKVLKPRIDLSYVEKIFYCFCIKLNAYKYHAFSREVRKEFAEILLPSVKDIPSWVYKIPVEKKVKNDYFFYKDICLKDREWSWFKCKDFFYVKKGNVNSKDCIKGNVHFITCTSLNNGISKYIDKIKGIMFYKNTITFSLNKFGGGVFYREKSFYADSFVNILQPNFEMNIYIAMFLITIIRLEKYRFKYDKVCKKQKVMNYEMRLPVKENGMPEWKFMEDFVKSLPYSINI